MAWLPTRRLVLLVLSASLAIFLGFFCFAPTTAVDIVRLLSARTVAVILVFFGIFLWRLIPWRRLADRQLWTRHAAGLLVVVLASTFVVSREPADFKVLMDEFVISAAAMGLHFDRDPAIMTRGHEVIGVFLKLGSYLDKRPLAYPLLLSLVHDISGYRVANTFYLNRGLTFVLLALLYGFACRLQGRRAAILAVLLLAGVPLLAQNASGGGFEVLNLVMILAAMHLGLSYLEKPSAASQGAFICALLLLAHTRFESAIYVLLGGGLILFQWRREGRPRIHWPLIAAPLALVPLPLQTAVFELDPLTFWQLPPGVSTPFGLSFVGGNLVRAFDFIFVVAAKSYSSPLLAAAGVISALLCALAVARSRRREKVVEDRLRVLFTFASGALIALAVVMFYSWGQLDDYEASRLSLPFFLMAALMVAAAFGQLKAPRWLYPALVVVSLAWVWAFTVPAAAAQYPSRRDHEMPRINWCFDHYQRLPPGRYLVVSPDRFFWAVHRISAIAPWMANMRAAEIDYHLDHRTFSEAIVFQLLRIDPITGERSFIRGNALADAFVLDTMAELSFSPFMVCRMSRVVAIDVARGTEVAEDDGEELRPGVYMTPIDHQHLENYVRRLP